MLPLEPLTGLSSLWSCSAPGIGWTRLRKHLAVLSCQCRETWSIFDANASNGIQCFAPTAQSSDALKMMGWLDLNVGSP